MSILLKNKKKGVSQSWEFARERIPLALFQQQKGSQNWEFASDTPLVNSIARIPSKFQIWSIPLQKIQSLQGIRIMRIFSASKICLNKSLIPVKKRRETWLRHKKSNYRLFAQRIEGIEEIEEIQGVGTKQETDWVFL